jgi:photosystem II stability/assembly factor-like uncharacterized protein
MVTATSGWGRVHNTAGPLDSQIAYTVDGGQTWYNVTPSGLVLNPQGSIMLYAQSTTRAWTWSSSIGSSPGESTMLWYTTDAGTQWTSYTVATGGVMQLDFIDATTGWLAATPYGSAMGQTPIDVWCTTNGGTSWTDIASTPVPGRTTGISFVNATTGFATAMYIPGMALMMSVSHDGGVTWTRVTLPAPSSGIPEGSSDVIMPPVFTSATDGVLEVTYRSAPTAPTILNIYRTTDAGASWQLGPALSGPAMTTGTSVPISVLANGDVFAAIVGHRLITFAQLTPGSTSWSTISLGNSSVPLFSNGVSQLDFVNSTTGWAVTASGLLRTTDGGVNWTVLHA